MYTSVAKFQIRSADLHKCADMLDEVGKTLRTVDGVIDCLVIWDENGAGRSITMYESAESISNSIDRLGAIWSLFGGYLEYPPEINTFGHAWKLNGDPS